jgi:hypothetical protein
VTVSACQDPDEGLETGGDATLSPGTLTVECTKAPASLTAVMLAVTGPGVVLVSTSAPGAEPVAVDMPVQYQADDSASGAPTSALGVPDEPTDVRPLPREATASDTPAITATTTTRIGQRRAPL